MISWKTTVFYVTECDEKKLGFIGSSKVVVYDLLLSFFL